MLALLRFFHSHPNSFCMFVMLVKCGNNLGDAMSTLQLLSYGTKQLCALYSKSAHCNENILQNKNKNNKRCKETSYSQYVGVTCLFI